LYDLAANLFRFLLGKPLYEEATRALLKSRALLPGEGKGAFRYQPAAS